MASFPGSVRVLIRGVADAVFPPACFGCRAAILGAAQHWCDACLQMWLAATGRAYCPTCGRGVGPYEVIDRRCGRCSGERFAHDGLVRVAGYEPFVRSLVRQYKFAGQQRLDRPLGECIAAAIESAPWRGAIEALVPVPSHWTVRWQRGFFSTGALTAQAARVLGLESLPLLVRPKRGRSQIGLPQTERCKNVRGNFHLARGANVEGRTLCVIDDVMVTGATLNENVRVLKQAGAKAVHVAIIAKVDSAAADV